MMILSNQDLFRQQGFLNGKWIDAEDKTVVEVYNPADNTFLGTVPKLGRDQVYTAVESANSAFYDWRIRTAKERASILKRWYELIMAAQEDLAIIMTSEQGKPFAESMSEIAYGASYIEWFAEEGKRIYGDTMPIFNKDRRMIVLKEPIGVCGAITPWNFPSAMVARKVAPALAAGCTVVVKPALRTPFSALALAFLAEQAGLPPGVFNVLTGPANEIGQALTENPLVRKLSFTGSTEVGKKLMRDCAATVKKMTMELGGHAPFLVFDDADLDEAVHGAMASKYRNSGQTCVCANRFIVQRGIYDRFAEKFITIVKNDLKVGNGFEEGVNLGPLIDNASMIKLEKQIQDAVAKGARLGCGGKRIEGKGFFFEPTVLLNVIPEMIISKEETFGPIAPLFVFDTEEEAINLANDTPYGLAAYFYSKDMNRIWRVAESLEYGMVGVNTGIMSSEAAPFGGVKESGVGREGSRYGIEEYLELKYLCLGGMTKT